MVTMECKKTFTTPAHPAGMLAPDEPPPRRTDTRGLTMQWEYKCVFIWGLGEATTRALNEYGRQGWELVCTWGPWHYFKRPLD